MTDSTTRPPRPDEARRAALLRHEAEAAAPDAGRLAQAFATMREHPRVMVADQMSAAALLAALAAHPAAAAPDAGLREALEAMADRYAADWGEGAESSEEYRNARAALAAHPAPAPNRGRQLVEDVRADRIRGSWDEPPFGAAPAGPAVPDCSECGDAIVGPHYHRETADGAEVIRGAAGPAVAGRLERPGRLPGAGR